MFLKMFQVDAFSDWVFGGNPAAVLVLEDWLPGNLMQSIAAENNLAETAFVKCAGDSWDLRWFTPTVEVDFCGHATLATAHVLVTEYGITGPLLFSTRIGKLKVEVKEDGYLLDLPCIPPEEMAQLPEIISSVFSDCPTFWFRNFENIFVVLSGENAVRACKPDLHVLAGLGPIGVVVKGQGSGSEYDFVVLSGENAVRACKPDLHVLAGLGPIGVVVKGQGSGSEYDFVSRYFAPGAGIPEDPVTGSIHATLVPYWAKKLGKNQLSAWQASLRGGHLICELKEDRVVIEGKAATFMKAEIFVPD